MSVGVGRLSHRARQGAVCGKTSRFPEGDPRKPARNGRDHVSHTNKQMLIEMIRTSNEVGETKAAAERALNAVLGAIEKGLKKTGKVNLVGFGSFTVKPVKARMGRNPRTGEPIKIPASKQPKFKAGKELKKAVNK